MDVLQLPTVDWPYLPKKPGEDSTPVSRPKKQKGEECGGRRRYPTAEAARVAAAHARWPLPPCSLLQDSSNAGCTRVKGNRFHINIGHCFSGGSRYIGSLHLEERVDVILSRCSTPQSDFLTDFEIVEKFVICTSRGGYAMFA